MPKRHYPQIRPGLITHDQAQALNVALSDLSRLVGGFVAVDGTPITVDETVAGVAIGFITELLGLCTWGQILTSDGCGGYTFREMSLCPSPQGLWVPKLNGITAACIEANGIANVPIGEIVLLCPADQGFCGTTTSTTTTTPGTTTTLAPPCPTTTTTTTTTTSTTTTLAGTTTTTTTTTTTKAPVAWAFTYCCGEASPCSPNNSTTTTLAPCSGLCTWTWSAVNAKWTLTCTGCVGNCACQYPGFCGAFDGHTTRTYCGQGQNSQPCCTSTTCGPTTSTTAGPTTTSTSTTLCPGCGCTGCIFVGDGNGGCLPVCTSCPPGCTCQTPQGGCPECVSVAGTCNCATTMAPPPCGGTCNWTCNFFGNWVGSGGACTGGCPCTAGTSTCGCTPPSVGCTCNQTATTGCSCTPCNTSTTTSTTTTCHPANCVYTSAGGGVWNLTTPCNSPCSCGNCTGGIVTPSGHTTLCPCNLPGTCCFTTTCNPQGNSCCGLCKWQGNGSGGWDIYGATCNPPGCTCLPPPYASSAITEEASTPCGNFVTTTTTTTTTSTTTTLHPCPSGYCTWKCNGSAWVNLQDNCTSLGGGCSCINLNNVPFYTCNANNNGQIINYACCIGGGCPTTTTTTTSTTTTSTTSTTTSTTTTMGPCNPATCTLTCANGTWSRSQACAIPCICTTCASGACTPNGATTMCPCIPTG